MAGKNIVGKSGFQTQYTPERIAEIVAAMELYSNNSDIPVLAEFAYLQNIPYATFHEIPELRAAKDKMLLKKQAVLEVGTLTGKYNATMAVFSLKQMGWKDKQDDESDHAKLLAGFNKIAEKMTGGH